MHVCAFSWNKNKWVSTTISPRGWQELSKQFFPRMLETVVVTVFSTCDHNWIALSRNKIIRMQTEARNTKINNSFLFILKKNSYLQFFFATIQSFWDSQHDGRTMWIKHSYYPVFICPSVINLLNFATAMSFVLSSFVRPTVPFILNFMPTINRVFPISCTSCMFTHTSYEPLYSEQYSKFF